MDDVIKTLRCSSCGTVGSLREYGHSGDHYYLIDPKDTYAEGFKKFVCKECNHVETFWFGAKQLFIDEDLRKEKWLLYDDFMDSIRDKIHAKVIYWYTLILDIVEDEVKSLIAKRDELSGSQLLKFDDKYSGFYRSYYNYRQDKFGKWVDRRIGMKEDLLKIEVDPYPFYFNGYLTTIETENIKKWKIDITDNYKKRYPIEAEAFKLLQTKIDNYLLSLKTKKKYLDTIEDPRDFDLFKDYVRYMAIAKLEELRYQALDYAKTLIDGYKDAGLDIYDKMMKVINTIDENKAPEF